MTRVELLEVGPRDGLQNEDMILDIDTRAELIRRLVDAGVRRMEAVSFVHPGRVPQMAHAEEVMAQVPLDSGVTYIGLVLNRRGAERALKTAVGELNMVVPVTDTFAQRNQGRTVEVLLQEAADVVRIAHDSGRTASLTLAVAFGCPFEGPVPIARVRDAAYRARDMGYDEIAFADTIGVGGARRVRQLVDFSSSAFDAQKLRFHFHNTRNTGYSNSVAAIGEAAALGLDVTLDSAVGGFGGCPFAPAATGNIATEDLLYSLEVDEIEMTHKPDGAKLVELARWLSERLEKPVQSLIPKAGWFPAER